MWGRSRSPGDQIAKATSDTLGDIKMGAIKGAAAGALGVLGAKAADAAKGVTENNGDLGKHARKAQKNAAKMLAQATETAKKRGAEAGKAADLAGKTTAAAGMATTASGMAGKMLQTLGGRVDEAQKQVADDGLHISVDPNDVPRLLRGVTLLATGLGTLFAPGSSLDVSQRADGTAAIGEVSDELVEQARQGIDTAASVAQQRIKDMVELTKEALSSLSDAVTAGIETAESKAQQALDETESRLTMMTEQASDKALEVLPGGKKRGGVMRWLFFGLVLGGLAAFFSSPLSGSLGERVSNLRRDLGLGGDMDDDSQYWPSPPQETSTTTTSNTTASGNSAQQSTPGVEMKSEPWSTNAEVKESTDKA